MTDLETMKSVLGMEDDFIPAREQIALWQELSRYMAEPRGSADVVVPRPVFTSMLRALVSAELQLAEAAAHIRDRDRDEVDIVAI